MSEQFKDLMELFIRADALLHRYQGTYFRNFGPFASPHKGQGRVLSLLKLQPEITQKELGYLLDMRNQSLGELLGKLERSGYITRTPSEKDRRVMNIKLTEEGAKAAEQLDGKQDDVNQIFSCLSDEEQAVLSDYLERLIDALEKTFEEMGIPEHEPGRPCGHSRPHPHGHPHQRERDFGGPQGFGKHEHKDFSGYSEHPGMHRHEDFSDHVEYPGTHGHEDFEGYAEHPGRHGHEDFLRYRDQFANDNRPVHPYRPDFTEGFNCPKHPGCHGNHCPECDFEEQKDAKEHTPDTIVDDSHINTDDIDTKDRNAE